MQSVESGGCRVNDNSMDQDPESGTYGIPTAAVGSDPQPNLKLLEITIRVIL